MDLTLALLLITCTAIGYAAGYVLGWTDHRTKARNK
jgi:hypothetical protein